MTFLCLRVFSGHDRQHRDESNQENGKRREKHSPVDGYGQVFRTRVETGEGRLVEEIDIASVGGLGVYEREHRGREERREPDHHERDTEAQLGVPGASRGCPGAGDYYESENAEERGDDPEPKVLHGVGE